MLFHERVAPIIAMRQQPSSAAARGASPAAARGAATSRTMEQAAGSAAAGMHDAPIVLLSDAEQYQ